MSGLANESRSQNIVTPLPFLRKCVLKLTMHIVFVPSCGIWYTYTLGILSQFCMRAQNASHFLLVHVHNISILALLSVAWIVQI